MWDLRETLGKDYVDSLLVNALRLQPITFTELLESLLIIDDDNEDLNDGTPNIVEICGSFDNHGISSPYCAGYTDNPIAIITFPGLEEMVSSIINGTGTINITGTAYPSMNASLINYTLMFGDEEIGTFTEPVIDDVLLYNWDTTYAEEGENTLTLTVTDSDNKVSEYSVTFVVNNILNDNPLQYDVLRAGDVIEISGIMMTSNDFQHYTIEWGIGENPAEWHTQGITLVNNGQEPIENGSFGYWNTYMVSEADYYTIRISISYPSFTSHENILIHLDPTLKEGWPVRVEWDELECPWGGVCHYWAGLFEPVIDDLNNDGVKEIIVYQGANPTKIHVFEPDGSYFSNWPVGVDEEDLPGGNLATPTIADLENDGLKEVLVNGRDGVYIYNWNASFRQLIPLYWSAFRREIVTSDLDNDNRMEFIKTYFDMQLPVVQVAVFDNQGEILDGWPQIFCNESSPDPNWFFSCIYPTSAVGNFDEDPELEIIVGGGRNVFDDPEHPYETWHIEGRVIVYDLNGSVLPGFPADFNGYTLGSVVSGDIDNDGYDEIIVGTLRNSRSLEPNNGLYVIDKNGDIRWSKFTDEEIWASPALVDFNNDNKLEIIVSILGFENYELDYDGNVLNKWPQYTTWNDYRSPISADINGDNIPDIVTTAGSGYYPNIEYGGVYAWNLNGTIIEGFPKSTEVDAQAAATIEDIDNDGKIELITSSDWDYSPFLGEDKSRSSIYVWELDNNYKPSTMHWPMLHHDSQHTGLYTEPPKAKSLIQNTGEVPIQGYLLMKVQKKVGLNWIDYEVVVDETTPRIIEPGDYLALDLIWNPLNVVIDQSGDYRIYAAFRDESGEVIETFSGPLEDYYEFSVRVSQGQ
jgi:hypothetical protein